MCGKITATRMRRILAGKLLRAPRDHDARALQRIARDALVQHQRDPRISEDVLGVHGKPRDQQNRRAVGIGADIDQRAIRVAATGHQGRERPLPAPPQQRFGRAGRVKIGGPMHQEFLAMLLQLVSFSG